MDAAATYRVLKDGTLAERHALIFALPPHPARDRALSELDSAGTGTIIVLLASAAISYCDAAAPEVGAALAPALHRLGVELFTTTTDHGLLPTTLSGLAVSYLKACSLLGRAEDVVAFGEEYIPFYTRIGEAQNLAVVVLSQVAALSRLNRMDEAVAALVDPEMKKVISNAPTLSANNPAGFRSNLDALSAAERFLLDGSSDDSQLSIRRRIREASALFVLEKQPPAEAIRKSQIDLERALAQTEQRDVVETIERVLRRSRIALGGDPGQLAAQVHARLHDETDSRLAMLGEQLARQTDAPWLRMHYGAMEWQADVEATYGLVGKVRALAFGQIEGQPLIAIGINDEIRLWDPRRGPGSDRVLRNDGRRLTAVALAYFDDHPVVVAASSYDQIAVIRDLHSGRQIGPTLEVNNYVNSIALARLGDRVAVAGAGNNSLFVWDARTGRPLTDVPPPIGRDWIRGTSVINDQLVAFVVSEAGDECEVSVIDIATGRRIWPQAQRFPSPPDIVAGSEVRARFVAAAGFSAPGPIFTWLPASPTERLSGSQRDNVGPLRMLAPGEVHGTPVVAYAPDYDGTALVSIRVASGVGERKTRVAAEPVKRLPSVLDQSHVEAVFVHGAADPIRKAQSGLALLTDLPLSIVPLDERNRVEAMPESETVTFALTGLRRSDLKFTGNSPSAFAEPPPVKRRSAADAPYRVDDPAQWPRSAHCYGVVSERAVIATGSIGGSVWIWDASTKALIAGPLTKVPERHGVMAWSRRDLRMKGAPESTSSIALGRHPTKGDVVAWAHDGSVRLASVPDGEEIPTPAGGSRVVKAVALGPLLGEDTLVTGSQGGVVVVWGLASNKRIAALTIDSPIEKVWVVRGADAIAVQTTYKSERRLFVMDVVVPA